MNVTQVLTESGSAGALGHADALGERMQLLLAAGKRALQAWKVNRKLLALVSGEHRLVTVGDVVGRLRLRVVASGRLLRLLRLLRLRVKV